MSDNTSNPESDGPDNPRYPDGGECVGCGGGKMVGGPVVHAANCPNAKQDSRHYLAENGPEPVRHWSWRHRQGVEAERARIVAWLQHLLDSEAWSDDFEAEVRGLVAELLDGRLRDSSSPACSETHGESPCSNQRQCWMRPCLLHRHHTGDCKHG